MNVPPMLFPGQGTTINAIHGFAGFGLDFEPFATEIIAPIRALQLPLDTGINWDENCYSTQQLTTLVDSLLPTNSIALGYSMGARLLLQWACGPSASLPKALILISGTPGIEMEADRLVRQRADANLVSYLEHNGVSAFFDFWYKIPIIQSQNKISSIHRSRMRANRNEHSIGTLRAALLQFGQGVMPSCWHLLHRVRCPVLLVVGAQDKKYCDLAQRMHARLPSSTLCVIPHVGHCPHLENPMFTALQVNKWFESLGLES